MLFCRILVERLYCKGGGATDNGGPGQACPAEQEGRRWRGCSTVAVAAIQQHCPPPRCGPSGSRGDPSGSQRERIKVGVIEWSRRLSWHGSGAVRPPTLLRPDIVGATQDEGASVLPLTSGGRSIMRQRRYDSPTGPTGPSRTWPYSSPTTPAIVWGLLPSPPRLCSLALPPRPFLSPNSHPSWR